MNNAELERDLISFEKRINWLLLIIPRNLNSSRQTLNLIKFCRKSVL